MLLCYRALSSRARAHLSFAQAKLEPGCGLEGQHRLGSSLYELEFGRPGLLELSSFTTLATSQTAHTCAGQTALRNPKRCTKTCSLEKKQLTTNARLDNEVWSDCLHKAGQTTIRKPEVLKSTPSVKTTETSN